MCIRDSDHSDGYSRGGGQRGGFYQNGGRSFSYNQQGPPRKHSGSKTGFCKNKDGVPYINGWHYSKRGGMVGFIAVPCIKSATKSPNSEKWVVSITPQFGAKITLTAFYNTLTRKLTIPDYGGGYVLNPSAPNGGYCGPFFKRSNNNNYNRR